MLPGDGDTLSKHIGEIMKKYSEKKYLEKMHISRNNTRKKIYMWFLENSEDFASKNMPLVYQFFNDLEDEWYIMSVQHLELLKETEISIALAQWILFSLEAGEYDRPWIAIRVIKRLHNFFLERWLNEEYERVQSLRNIF